MARPPAKDLTDRELEVMHVFWKHREATAAEVRDHLAAAGLDRTYPTIANFAAWLLARLSVALHFWHPLVRCLAGRLQLHQELADDDTAAQLAGGRTAYLRVLAELALRSDGRASGWPAPAFLSRKGNLLRRVEMLRVMDDGRKRPTSRTDWQLTVVLVLALALASSALRSPGQEAVKRPPAAAAQTAAVVPFDLSLLGQSDGKEDGVFGVRPAAILNLGRLEELAEPALRKAAADSASPEVRRRAEALLARLESAVPGAGTIQALRAVEVLERIGRPDARQLLQRLAAGAPEALLGREAKGALERLRSRSPAGK
jgi:hypothetical protein